jgi:hypothetical protein
VGYPHRDGGARGRAGGFRAFTGFRRFVGLLSIACIQVEVFYTDNVSEPSQALGVLWDEDGAYWDNQDPSVSEPSQALGVLWDCFSRSRRKSKKKESFRAFTGFRCFVGRGHRGVLPVVAAPNKVSEPSQALGVLWG